MAVYRVPDTANLLWSGWDDACIVYDQRSGHTQVLNDFARELLAIYEDGQKTLVEIYEEFEKIFEKKLDENLKLKILESVREFDNMGLIEPV
ncbi:MAG: HPr-rel-A system PqqD family peptide chaperone [Emcibacteraceae bacterium]|nr:HPr-rel-A system PqqD family peptide chaperone [Emcibacteraceae bacterium]